MLRFRRRVPEKKREHFMLTYEKLQYMVTGTTLISIEIPFLKVEVIFQRDSS